MKKILSKNTLILLIIALAIESFMFIGCEKQIEEKNKNITSNATTNEDTSNVDTDNTQSNVLTSHEPTKKKNCIYLDNQEITKTKVLEVMRENDPSPNVNNSYISDNGILSLKNYDEDYLFPFSKLINNNFKWGYRDKNGKEVIPPTYDEAYLVDENRYSKILLDGKYGILNTKTKKIHNHIFKELLYHNKDCAVGFDTTGCGIFVNDNKISTYDNVSKISQDNGAFIFYLKNDNYLILNNSGKKIVEFNGHHNIFVIQDKFVLISKFIYNEKSDSSITETKLFDINGKKIGEIKNLCSYDIYSSWNNTSDNDVFYQLGDGYLSNIRGIKDSNNNHIIECDSFTYLGNHIGFDYIKEYSDGYLNSFINLKTKEHSEKKYYNAVRVSPNKLLGVSSYGLEFLNNDFEVLKTLRVNYYSNYEVRNGLLVGWNDNGCCIFITLDGEVLWEENMDKQVQHIGSLDVLNKHLGEDPFSLREYPCILTKGYDELNAFMDDITKIKINEDDRLTDIGRTRSIATGKLVKVNDVLKLSVFRAFRFFSCSGHGTCRNHFYFDLDGRKIPMDNIFIGDYSRVLTEKINDIMDKDEHTDYNYSDFEFNPQSNNLNFTEDELIIRLYSSSLSRNYDYFSIKYEDIKDVLNENHPLIKGILGKPSY
ncbi:WG repeat-containing protein [Oceanirhabdus seepicola]|uniref:WG repeat-containing protein n=1 Tax=Oceanirhabdus seepicola TaxID=2828781 RepID=A0A9J6P3P0_9CLOT|nr:WG repeat-containing protein [Oceanirhabdus seepicola]MCM1991410.1 WG repeat-containing protein [Oceanirhabdus seepicola]